MDHASMADHQMMMAAGYAFALVAIAAAWVKDKALLQTRTALGLYAVMGTHPILMLLLPSGHNVSLIAFFWCFAVMVQALRA